MSQRFAQIISVLFHPIFVPIYLLLLLPDVEYLFLGKIAFDREAIIGVGAVLLVLLPLLCLFFLRLIKVVSSLSVRDRKQRVWLYVFTILCYTLFFLFTCLIYYPRSLTYLMFGMTLSLIIVTIVNFFWKISAHATGISGLLGGFLFGCLFFKIFSLPLCLCFVLLGGLVCSSRLKLLAHTPLQLIFGYINGLTCSLILPTLLLL